MSDDLARLPPQDLDAEMSVLGSMLLSRDAIADVVEVLQPTDFYLPANEAVYDTILDLFSRGEPVDTITVAAAMGASGTLQRAGGALYLHTLSSAVPLAANAGYYAEIVRDKAVLRRVIEACIRGTNRAYVGEGEVSAIVDTVQAEVLAVTAERSATDYAPLGEILSGTIDEIEAVGIGGGALQGVGTGFVDLDDLLNGLGAGQFIVVAGRPSMGKSTLGVDFLRAASIQHGLTSAIFSLEMTKHEITTRVLSAEAKVSLNKLRGGHLADHDWGRIAGVMEKVSVAPMFIDDSPNMTMTEIRAKARRLKQNHDLRLIVIDYMQLMSSGKKVESRQNEVSEFSRQMKLLAKELEVPVVGISQLNRGPEQRTNKRPMMADLRESGAIEQDADIVILLHREDYYTPEGPRMGEADLIVAKHRNGPTRDVTVAFQGHYARFVDMAG